MRALVTLLALILLLLPAVYGIAQPDNLTQELSPEDIEWKRKIDEKINMTKLKELEEMEVTRPSLTPEPNVYVPGRGYVTDEQGRFISPLGYYETDYYFDIYGNGFYVYVNDILIFGSVADSQFKGTYFSVFDRYGNCLNCNGTHTQTFPDYKHYNNWIKPYVEKNYPKYFKIHVKYFLQAKLEDYVRKNGKTVYLILRTTKGYLTKFEAELWSEENYCKERNDNPKLRCYHAGWGNNRCGYPDDPDGGASRIRGKTIKVSVGFSYYTPYPGLASRKFGRPYVIMLWSRFYHQFAIISAS